MVSPFPLQLGQACTCGAGGCTSGDDDCDVGLTCLQGATGSFCFELCGCGYGDPTCEQTPNAVCDLINEGALPICTPACNPLDPVSCPAGFNCRRGGPGDFSCFPGTNTPLGEACTAPNDCETGAICVSGEALPWCEDIGCCVPTCHINDGDVSCPEQWSGCTTWYGENPAPDVCLEGLGVCASLPT